MWGPHPPSTQHRCFRVNTHRGPRELGSVHPATPPSQPLNAQPPSQTPQLTLMANPRPGPLITSPVPCCGPFKLCASHDKFATYSACSYSSLPAWRCSSLPFHSTSAQRSPPPGSLP